MENQTTKQKLINLVSSLETDSSIEYFYTFIALRLYGTADCPAKHFQEVCKIHEQSMKSQEEERKKQPESTEEEKEWTRYIRDISRKLYDIKADTEGIWLLNEIDKFIENITK